jgi:hypothetical protein
MDGDTEWLIVQKLQTDMMNLKVISHEEAKANESPMIRKKNAK